MRLQHSAVGRNNESDVILAKANGAVIIGFNVRANPQARDLAQRDGVEIRYYSIIYDVIDDMRNALSGMLAPTLRERFLGNAAIREVFNITRAGKVAGCMITEGVVRRGAKVRLLRDNVVIHEGSLKTLKRFKDEVREVREGNIAVPEVRLSPDLRNAAAYVMPLAGANVGEIMGGLQRSAPFLKARLARELDLRFVPNLVFALDHAFESAERIAALLASPAVERDLHPDPENGDEPG